MGGGLDVLLWAELLANDHVQRDAVVKIIGLILKAKRPVASIILILRLFLSGGGLKSGAL